eukprot:TRINITY_DN1908_c1_g1_i2.p1 TRINITY_DN1908_c1_g1~~TRINITY_DN1908_c1_g1_i2.p1  ORF type:complete len:406 (+),score=52.27 TRINITY_DN1908_c1_g1_i2:130-1347(+)
MRSSREIIMQDQTAPHAPLKNDAKDYLSKATEHWEKIINNEEDTVYAVVFPRAVEAGGEVDQSVMIEDPLDKVTRIFLRHGNPESSKTLETGFETMAGNEAMPMADYQMIVRRRFLEVIRDIGIQASPYETIDQDEVIVRLSFDPHGQVLQILAEKQKYKMPFVEEVYEELEPLGRLAGGRPMENRLGVSVVGYGTYKIETAHEFEPFRLVDQIRIMRGWLNDWMDLGEMQAQGVISLWCLSDRQEELENLRQEYSFLDCIRPCHVRDGQIRDYYGEEIAFLFSFATYFTRSLIPLGLISVIYYICRYFIPADVGGYAKTSLGLVFGLWSALFFGGFDFRASRYKQMWGVTTVQERAMTWPYSFFLLDSYFFARLLADFFTSLLACSLTFLLLWPFDWSTTATTT